MQKNIIHFLQIILILVIFLIPLVMFYRDVTRYVVVKDYSTGFHFSRSLKVYVGFVCLFLGIIFLASFVIFLNTAIKLQRTGTVATGTVYEFKAGAWGKGKSISYKPMVRFNVVGEKSERLVNGSPRRTPGIVGEKIEVIYQPEDIRSSAINSFYYIYGTSLFVLFASLGSFVFFYLLVFKYKN